MNKNKNKKIILTLGLGVIFIITLYYCIKTNNKIVPNEYLNDKIISKLESEKYIDFSKVTNFHWDEMMIFTPYSDINEYFKKVDIDNSIKYRDDIYSIVFIENNKIIKMVNLDRKYDFDTETTNRKIENKNSKFKILNNNILYKDK